MAMPSPVELSGFEVYRYTLLAPPVASTTKRLKHLHVPRRAVQHVSTGAAARVAAQLGKVDQVDGEAVVDELDVGMIEHSLCQRFGQRLAGCVRHVQHAALAVAAFAGEVVLVVFAGRNPRPSEDSRGDGTDGALSTVRLTMSSSHRPAPATQRVAYVVAERCPRAL